MMMSIDGRIVVDGWPLSPEERREYEQIHAWYDANAWFVGGGINGSMPRAGLIDEFSVLVAPVADGRVGTASLLDVVGEDATPTRLQLEHVERRTGDVLWLRYRVEREASRTSE